MINEIKNPEIEWIGQIPNNWTIGRIGQMYAERNVKVSDSEYPPLSVTMQGILPQLSSAAKSDAHDNRKLVKKGDFAINSRSDRRGSCGISQYDGSVSLINTILMPKQNMDPEYYNWLFHSTMFSDEFYKWGHGIVDDLWTTRWQDMKKIGIPVPPIDEQRKIASFLNFVCENIENLINRTQMSIDEYKILKRSVIMQAVTQGIDRQTETEGREVKWVGYVSSRFNIFRLKHLVYILDQYRKPVTADERSQSGEILYDYYGASGIIDKIDGFTIDDHVMLIGEDGANLRMRNLPLMYEVNGKAWINNHAHILKPKRDINFYYLFYALEGLDINPYITGSAQPKLSQENLKAIKVPVPTLAEQEFIAEYLKIKCAKIDELIQKKKSFVSELENYKKALIYEYVTGKRRVV